MLTGDNEIAAKNIADKIHIKKVYAGLLPEDKVNIIKEMKKEENVIFIGDGINDGPVLAEVDFGISMGEGTEIANTISDGILISNNIQNIPGILKIAKKTMNIVKFNITFSLLAKICVLTLGVLGFAPVWLAVFADTGTTVITVINSLRIFSKK